MVARSPGNTTPISIAGNGQWKYCIGTSCSTLTRTGPIVIDNRPSYNKSQHKQVGGRFWKSPTNYCHNSRVVTLPGAAFVKQGQVTITETNPSLSQYIDLSGNGTIPSLQGRIYPNLWNAAMVKALNSIADNKAGLGEDLATYAQTVRMFTSKGQALGNLLGAFKRDPRMRNFRKRPPGGGVPKKVSDAYLEYVYGWKPLVSDLYGIIQLVKQYSSGIKPIIVHGHGKMDQSTTSALIRYKPGQSGANAQNYIVGTTTSVVKVRCDLYARVDPNLIAFRILNQLGLLNPLSLEWELVPWSFVVDWLLPIGPWLQSLTAPIGLNFVSGSVAERVSRLHLGKIGLIIDGYPNPEVDQPIPFTAVDELYNREALATWPTPLPYIDLNPLRGDRALKALALTISNLKR